MVKHLSSHEGKKDDNAIEIAKTIESLQKLTAILQYPRVVSSSLMACGILKFRGLLHKVLIMCTEIKINIDEEREQKNRMVKASLDTKLTELFAQEGITYSELKLATFELLNKQEQFSRVYPLMG